MSIQPNNITDLYRGQSIDSDQAVGYVEPRLIMAIPTGPTTQIQVGVGEVRFEQAVFLTACRKDSIGAFRPTSKRLFFRRAEAEQLMESLALALGQMPPRRDPRVEALKQLPDEFKARINQPHPSFSQQPK